LFLKIEIHFPLNNYNLFRPIDTKLGVWVAYIKTQLGIATQVYQYLVESLKTWFGRIAAHLVSYILPLKYESV